MELAKASRIHILCLFKDVVFFSYLVATMGKYDSNGLLFVFADLQLIKDKYIILS